MKKLGLLLTALAILTLTFAGTKEVNTELSNVQWEGKKVTGAHNGDIKIKSGSFTFENEILTGGTIEMDMASMTCTDLQGDMAGKLMGHLKSADFFDVENHPTASYVITKVVSRGMPGEYKLIGNMTIKGITQEVKLNVKFNENNSEANAQMQLDRTDYNVKYGSGSFFDNLGDKTIFDEFTLNISLILK